MPKNKYTANYEMLNDVEIVQNFNNLLTAFLATAINLFVIIRLLHRRTSVHGLRRLLLVQSTIAVLDAIVWECANEIQTVGKSGYIKVGHPFLPPSYDAIRYLLCVEEFFSALIKSTIAIFNLHRLIIVTRLVKLLGNILKFYGITGLIKLHYYTKYLFPSQSCVVWWFPSNTL